MDFVNVVGRYLSSSPKWMTTMPMLSHSNSLMDEDPGIMSEAETSATGFRRGSKQRATLPVVRTPSKTLERPLGETFILPSPQLRQFSRFTFLSFQHRKPTHTHVPLECVQEDEMELLASCSASRESRPPYTPI